MLLDDLGILTEFVHVGVDIETYYEKYKHLPELDDLG